MFIICTLDIVEVTSHLPWSHLAFMRWDNFGILTSSECEVTYVVLDLEVSPPPHKVTSHDMWDSFGILTSRGREVDARWLMGFWATKCPLHHTKSSHVTHETALSFSPGMDTRWTQGDLWGSGSQMSHSAHKVISCDTQDSFGILTLHQCEVDTRWMWGDLCGSGLWSVPSTTQSPHTTCMTALAFSPHMDAR